jgi:predicted ArsR family transcriptional regulator
VDLKGERLMRDPKTEQQLDRGKFSYRFVPEFKIAKIDLARSKANPARLNRTTDLDRCGEMGQAMTAGVDFPAIVLIEDVDGIIVATGMHRLIAATEHTKPPRAVFDAYLVIETDPYRRELLMRSINCIEGRGQTRDENLAHCAEMHRLYGGSIDDLAAAFNLRGAAIREYLRALKFDERAAQAGVGELTNGMPAKTKQLLAKVQADATLADLVRTLKGTKASGEVAKQLIEEVIACHGEKQAQKLLERRQQEFVEQQESAKRQWGGRRGMDIPTKAMKPIRTILNFSARYANDPTKLQFGALEETQLGADLAAAKDMIEVVKGWVHEMTSLMKLKEKARSWKPQNGERTSAGSSPSA